MRSSSVIIPSLSLIFNLEVGDWSHDGHERTQDNLFISSHSAADINLAYRSAVELIGVDIVEDVCDDYEDNMVSPADAKRINAKLDGILDVLSTADSDNPDDYALDIDGFVKLYLAYIHLGNAAIQMVPVISTDIHIGGYGLFN